VNIIFELSKRLVNLRVKGRPIYWLSIALGFHSFIHDHCMLLSSPTLYIYERERFGAFPSLHWCFSADQCVCFPLPYVRRFTRSKGSLKTRLSCRAYSSCLLTAISLSIPYNWKLAPGIPSLPIPAPSPSFPEDLPVIKPKPYEIQFPARA